MDASQSASTSYHSVQLQCTHTFLNQLKHPTNLPDTDNTESKLFPGICCRRQTAAWLQLLTSRSHLHSAAHMAQRIRFCRIKNTIKRDHKFATDLTTILDARDDAINHGTHIIKTAGALQLIARAKTSACSLTRLRGRCRRDAGTLNLLNPGMLLFVDYTCGV